MLDLATISGVLFDNRAFQFMFNLLALSCTITWGPKAFLVHVVYVTNVLVGELIRIANLHGQLPVPYDTQRKIIILVGYIHTINPLLMYVWPILIYFHVPLCFMVHCCHLTYIHAAFRKMEYYDLYHAWFLVLLNLAEFISNITIRLNPQFYLYSAVATEAVCPYLLTFRMKKVRFSSGSIGSKSTGKLGQKRKNDVLLWKEKEQKVVPLTNAQRYELAESKSEDLGIDGSFVSREISSKV